MLFYAPAYYKRFITVAAVNIKISICIFAPMTVNTIRHLKRISNEQPRKKYHLGCGIETHKCDFSEWSKLRGTFIVDGNW